MMRQLLILISEHNTKHTVAVLVLPCEFRILDVEDVADVAKPDMKCVMLYVTLLHKGISKAEIV